MGRTKHLKCLSHITALLIVFMLFAQHAVLCSKASAAPLADKYSNTTLIQHEQIPSESNTQTMGIDCSHPCHFSTLSAPSPSHQKALFDPKHYPTPSERFALKGMISAIFHPPTFS